MTRPPVVRLTEAGTDALPFGMPLLIGDPAAAHEDMFALRRALAHQGVTAASVIAREPGRAREAAQAALAAGTRFLVAVGGDALAHELVGALVDPAADVPDGDAQRPVLGLVGCGRQDLAATFGLPDDPEEAARHLLGGNLFTSDVGRARWLGPDGTARVRVFANAAELGYPGELSVRRVRLQRAGRAGRLAAALAALAVSRSSPAHLVLKHAAVDFRLAGLVVANGQFSMGRMKVAPRALPDDGRLSVIAFEGEPLAIYAKSARVYYGDHVPDPTVREYQSPTVEVDTADPMPLALDGTRVAGGPPFAFDVLPAALLLKV